jgi:hypothetical protein
MIIKAAKSRKFEDFEEQLAWILASKLLYVPVVCVEFASVLDYDSNIHFVTCNPHGNHISTGYLDNLNTPDSRKEKMSKQREQYIQRHNCSRSANLEEPLTFDFDCMLWVGPIIQMLIELQKPTNYLTISRIFSNKLKLCRAYGLHNGIIF